MKEQIEEIARIICADSANKGLCEKCGFNKGCWKFKDAEAIYNAGYRKQSVGEWIKDEESKFEHRYHCSVCNFYLIGEPTKHCEDCGAKMKGGAE